MYMCKFLFITYQIMHHFINWNIINIIGKFNLKFRSDTFLQHGSANSFFANPAYDIGCLLAI